MAEEHRITPEMAALARQEIARALESETGRADLNLFGTQLELERASDGQISVRTPDQSVMARLFAASDAPPPGYPDILPFIPGEPVIATETEADSWSLMWMSPTDPEGVFRSLIEQSLLSGWALEDGQEFPQIPAKQRRLHSDTATREIMMSGPIVSLYVNPK